MTEKNDAAEIAASTVGRTLLKCLADELEKNPRAWNDMSEVDQHHALERMRQSVRLAVSDALRLIFGQSMPACPATLEGLSSKGSISMRLTVAKSAANRHELLDAVGTQVVVLIGNPDDYMEGLNDIKAKAQQQGLFDEPNLPDLEDLGPIDEAEPQPEAPPPPAEPGPEDIEANWVETARDRDVEQNVVTGAERASKRALGHTLLDKITTYNADPKHPTIRFEGGTVMAATRGELLMALQWFDAYIADSAALPEGVVQPTFLLPESPAP